MLSIVLSIAVCAGVTALLRFLPFLIFGGKRTVPEFILYLGRVLPYAIMGMLCVYCLKNTSFGTMSGYLPQLIAGAVVVLTYIWKRNTLLSIVGGTLVYMALVQFVFV